MVGEQVSLRGNTEGQLTETCPATGLALTLMAMRVTAAKVVAVLNNIVK